MPSFGSILSVKNGIRFGAIVSIVVGSPMMIAPALAVKFFLGKRDEGREAEKKALNVAMRSNGIAIFACGLRGLLARPTVGNLVGDVVMEGLYSLYHTCNRLCNEWKDAEGRTMASNVFLPAAWTVLLIQAVALSCGDREDDEEKEES